MGKIKDKSINERNNEECCCAHYLVCRFDTILCSLSCSYFSANDSEPNALLSDEQLEQFGRHVGGIVHFSLGFNEPLKSAEIKKILQTAEDYLFYVNDLMVGG